MKLRLILLVLSLLAFLSASSGGYIYYSSLQDAAFKEAERQAAKRVEMIQKNLSFFLSEHIGPVRALSGMDSIRDALSEPSASANQKANQLLDYFNYSFKTDVCYLMNGIGITVASSNRNYPDSFVGKDFGFRPYFTRAMEGVAATYLALGITSARRGAYFSHPVYHSEGEKPLGVVVMKASIEQVENELNTNPDEIVFVTDPNGLIFISSRKNWLYHLVSEIGTRQMQAMATTQQFGEGPWESVGLELNNADYARDSEGTEYLVHKVPLKNYLGWRVYHLQSLSGISRRVSEPLLRTTGPIVVSLCFLVGLSVLVLYSRASREIARRKKAEKALRESEERYRFIYHNTPAMLHSVDPSGRLVRVSDHWLEALGYERKEVIGKKLLDFLTAESGKFVAEHVIPRFFKTGLCKDVPYQFVKKDGTVREILLSAIGERDGEGKVIRSLAVSIDVTERKKAEESLKKAKEQLSRYSKDLEEQVRKRTEEITNILRYTPDVVSIKDHEGRYLLVNSRFEELFGIRNEQVRGKNDFEIHSRELAEQFLRTDQRVLLERRACQVEERVPQSDGVHTYLSVKFPVYGGSDIPTGVGSISTDISAVKKAQDRLRRLSGRIMSGQEKERAAIARELHDELGQVLTALNMDAVWLCKRLESACPEAAERASAMRRLIDETLNSVRGMALRLRPKVLDDLGLVEALEWLTTDFEKRTEINCVFNSEKISKVRGKVATAAYRICQEALTNVARHSFANQVEVELAAQEGTLQLTISDNGRGFNTLDLSESEGLGITGMRERATLANGILIVDAAPDKGTRVCFKAPLNGDSGNKKHA